MFGFGGFGGPEPPRNVDNKKFYDLLGVPKDASQDQIRKAFRKLAMTHHPDKGGDEEKFKEIRKAYEVLSNEETKEVYDKYGEEGLENGGGGGGPADIFDLFGGGGGRRQGKPQKRRGEDVVFPLKVTLEDLYTSTTKKLRLTKSVICADCQGKGGRADAVQTCKGCKGQGVKLIVRQLGPGMIQQMQSYCSDCNGEGRVIAEEGKCKACNGNRTVKETKTLEVFVAKGMKHNQKVVFQGEGDEAPDTVPGDVVVVLQQKPHDVFTRDDQHLFMKKTITLVEALCGFEFHIKHLDERVLVIKSEPGSIIRPNDTKAIENEGMPQHKNPYAKGKLYIHFDVDFPKPEQLADNTRKLLQKVLPAPVPEDFDMGGAAPEEVHLTNVDIAAEKAMHEDSKREAYEEEDDERAGPQMGGGCRQA